jgi:hypothetical protein
VSRRGYDVIITGGGVMPERYQREIEEILQDVGESTPIKEPVKSNRSSLLSPFASFGRSIDNRVYLSARRFMAIGIVLLLSALFVSVVDAGFLGPFIWLGLIMFILMYALFFAWPNQGPEKRWRGRLIEQKPPSLRGEGLLVKLRSWIKG